MQPTADPVERAITESFASLAGAFGPGARTRPLVVGVSGGSDSTALLHALCRHWPTEALVVAHLDHGLRPDSAKDLDHVAALARKWRLRFIGERRGVGAMANAGGLGVEEAARQARYAFLAETARREGATVVAVGHHAGDQAETLLMHVLRGSGPAGLRGMPTFGPLPGAADLQLWRPLLAVEKTDIDAYCLRHDLPALIDPTNDDPALFRNRLRHEALPYLESISPGVARRLNQLSSLAAAEDDLLAELEVTAWAEVAASSGGLRVELDLEKWRALPLALRRRLLRRAAATAAPARSELGFASTEAARRLAETGQTGAVTSLPGGLRLVLNYDRLVIAADPTPLPGTAPQVIDRDPHPLSVPGQIVLEGGWLLTAEPVVIEDWADVVARPSPWQVLVSASLLGSLWVRPRRPGERIQPLGLGGHETKIKEVFIDRKVPAPLRSRWPIIATPEHPVWIAGHVLDERARVFPGVGEAILLRCRPV